MKFETLDGVNIPKIGFGTWRIGGEGSPDPALEEASQAALRSALELGYSHFDTAEYYAHGHAEELLGQALRDFSVPREAVFITSKVSPEHLKYEAVLLHCAESLRRLQTDYLDLYLVHWPNPLIKLEETFKALNQLVREGRVRHVGVSNFKLKELKKAKSLCESPLFTDQVRYNLPDRTFLENGVVGFCQQNDVLVTAYSPVKFRNLNVNPIIREIGEVHNATAFQIALAWLAAQPRVITIPMSYDPVHQKQNLEAGEIELSASELETLNRLYSR